MAASIGTNVAWVAPQRRPRLTPGGLVAASITVPPTIPRSVQRLAAGGIMEAVTSPAPAVPPVPPGGDRQPDEPSSRREPRATGASKSYEATDPDRSDDPRAVLARRRGLPGPYITGGEDADPTAGRREERRYGSLLLAMVIVIVLAGFVLGVIGVLLGAGVS